VVFPKSCTALPQCCAVLLQYCTVIVNGGKKPIIQIRR
jgi:hypothetical protein